MECKVAAMTVDLYSARMMVHLYSVGMMVHYETDNHWSASTGGTVLLFNDMLANCLGPVKNINMKCS